MRKYAWQIAGALVNLALDIALVKGWADRIPNGVVFILFSLSIAPIVFWTVTHEKLLRQREWTKAKFRQHPIKSSAVAAVLILPIIFTSAFGLAWLYRSKIAPVVNKPNMATQVADIRPTPAPPSSAETTTSVSISAGSAAEIATAAAQAKPKPKSAHHKKPVSAPEVKETPQMKPNDCAHDGSDPMFHARYGSSIVLRHNYIQQAQPHAIVGVDCNSQATVEDSTIVQGEGKATYIQIRSPGPNIQSSMHYETGMWPMIIFVQRNGDYPAIDVVESAGLEIYDFAEPFDPEVFESTPEMEDKVWNRFITDFEKGVPRTLEPHDERNLVAALNRRITEAEAAGLTNHIKLYFILAFVAWTDGTGRHELQHCEYIPVAPTEVIHAADCKTHMGLAKKVDF
jgi:hypothetical protein